MKVLEEIKQESPATHSARTGRVRRHVQRFLPFYGFALVWLLIMSLFPTQPRVVRRADDFGVDGGSQQPRAVDGSIAAGDSGSTRLGSGESSVGGSGVDTGSAVAGGQRSARSGIGVTRGGFECKPGVRQMPGSSYAAPCRPKWTGPNPGATYRGVTPTTIKIVSRDYTDNPQTQAVYAAQQAAGEPRKEDIRKMRNVFVDHFNKVYELYGRRVVVEDYTTNADLVAEVSNEGREKACADAAEIAEGRRAFGVLPPAGFVGLGPFSECAAERGMFVPIGPYGFPEQWYRRHHPYVWAIQMDCERIGHLLNEYVVKRLVGRQAAWANDPSYRGKPRVFGSIRPDIDVYRPCTDLFDKEFKRRGLKLYTFDYVFDPATMPRQAAQAVAQFKSQGVSTLVLGSDFLMNINLTQQANTQRWGPEWITAGVGFQDIDNYARLYDQGRVDGHMFGLSQLGATAGMRGPNSEPFKLYRKLTGENPPPNTDGEYFNLVHLFNFLQEAGPDLRPENMPAAALRLPPIGAPDYANGLWNFRRGPTGEATGADHTAVDDAREVYWDGGARGYDRRNGTWVETFGGRRFTNGRWPSGQPDVYPKR